MADINEHTIQGRLAADPRILSNERGSIARMRVMTNYRYQDAKGEWQTRDTGHTVIVRGDLVEVVDGLKTGDPLMVIGFVEERDYTDSQGVKRTERQVVAKKLYRPLLAQRRRSAADNGQADAPSGSRPASPRRDPSPAPRQSPAPSGTVSNPPPQPARATASAPAASPSGEDEFADADNIVRSFQP